MSQPAAIPSSLTAARRNRRQRAQFALRRIVLALGLSVLPMQVRAAEEAEHPATIRQLKDLTLEQLLDTKIVAASKYEQPMSAAPALVSVLSAEDFKLYGHRTLGDALRSLRDFNVSYDRNYQYLGVRGFGRPGDYNSRLLVMVDGHRINDNVQDSGSIGSEFLLDVDLIDRVEIIRGPSSSVYGNNAFFAVINVITRRGASVGGAEVSGEAASFDTYQGRFTYGNKLASDLELLISGTFFDSRGHSRLFYPEYAATNGGQSVGRDGDQSRSGFLSLAWKELAVQGGYVTREKGIPTGSFKTIFKNGGSRTVDRRGYADVKFAHEFENETRLVARAYYDRYEYDGDYAITNGLGAAMLSYDVARGDRVGTDLQVTRQFFDRLTVAVGVEFRESLRQSQRNFDTQPPALNLSTNTPTRDVGVHAQGEWSVLPQLALHAGARFDHTPRFGDKVSPRAAVVWTPLKPTTVKLLYGEAFRAPNAYEQFYNDGGASQTNSPALQPETIRTYELSVEQQLGEHFSLSASAFYYHINDLITQQETAPLSGVTLFRNVSSVASRGLGLELLSQWPGGLRGRASYALTRAEDLTAGTELSNSPRHQAKLNVAVPLWRENIFAGLEWQYTTSRHTRAGTSTGDYHLASATLFSRDLVKGMELSASIYNLLDQRFSDPASGNFVQQSIPQDGRSYRVKLAWRF